MEDGPSKAIPLRRSRGSTRTPTGRPLRLTERLTAGVRLALSPPRQIWLAGLGSAVLAARGTRPPWAHLVAEGAAVEGRPRRTVRRAADPRARRGPEAHPRRPGPD